MTTGTTFALNCPICLDKLQDPVVTPCGHTGCDSCIKTYARRSRDAYKATCPTCRAPFSIVTPDLSIVPKKYHNFISPPLRRIFLDAREDNSRTVVKNLNAEIAALKEYVTSLEHHKDLLKDRYDAAQYSLACLRAGEETARLSYYKLNRVTDEYNAHKSPGLPKSWAEVKRTSGQATLDYDSPSSPSDSSPSSEPGSSQTWTVKC